MIRTTASSHQNYKLGLSMTCAGGLLLSVDLPLIRLAQADPWTIIVVRGIFAFVALWAFWIMFQRGRKGASPFVNGYLSVLISCMTAVVSIMLINAVHLTSVANIVFILAFNPLFAAIFSWVLMGERPSTATMVAVCTALVGVAMIVWDGISAGNPLGDFLALGVSVILALALTLIRRSGTDQSMSPAFGSLLAATAILAFAEPSSLAVHSWFWLAINGLIVIPLSSALMFLGPKYIAAPIVALFFLLETVLTPVWMWLIFNEVPTVLEVIGGAIIVTTLLLHNVWTLVQMRRTESYRFNFPGAAAIAAGRR